MDNLVVDACVFVGAFKADEEGHDESLRCLRLAQSRGAHLWAPITVFWEVAAAFNHPGKTTLSSLLVLSSGVFTVSDPLHIDYIPMDGALLQRTWEKVTQNMPITGGDRIYLSCAADKDALLITRDATLRKHAASVGVRAQTPSEYLGE